MEYIKGNEFLEPQYKFTKRDFVKAVKKGELIPLESPDTERIKKYGSLDPDLERVWRVFPTDKLQRKYKLLISLQYRLEMAKKWSQKSDEEHIEAHKENLAMGFRGEPLEIYVNEKLPKEREEYIQVIQELTPQIEKLEEELAPDRVWRDLRLGPIQENKNLMDILLNAWYLEKHAEAFIKAPPKQQKPKTRDIKEKVREIAHELWKENPTMTITDMVYILPNHTKEITSRVYSESYLRKWVNDLCPNRKPGRRPKK